MVDPHEGPPKQVVEIPKTPQESLGDRLVAEGRVDQWVEFGQTQWVRIYLKASSEIHRIRAEIFKEITGEESYSEERDVVNYNKFVKEGLTKESYQNSNNHEYRLWLAHHLGQAKMYLESMNTEERKKNLSEISSSPEALLEFWTEGSLRRWAKNYSHFIEESGQDYPSAKPLKENEEELYQRMKDMVDRNLNF